MSDSLPGCDWKLIETFPHDSPHKDAIEPSLKLGESLELAVGGEFTGRVATQLIRDAGNIVKMRNDVSGNLQELSIIVREFVERETALAIYPQDKTWFIVSHQNGYQIGNICRELIPINQYVDNARYASPDELVDVLMDIYGMSIRIMVEYKYFLDISLSNFGLDTAQNTIFYLDDDVYRGGEDDFTILSESISSIIRNYPELPDSIWFPLGETLRELTDKYFGGAYVGRISYAIGDAPLIRPEAIECRNSLIKGFVKKKIPKVNIESTEVRVNSQHGQDPAVIGSRSGPAKIALLSDIHANLPALEAVLKELQQHNILQIVIMGDIVGYGPDPESCIERVRSLNNTQVIKGNHDHGAGTQTKEEVVDNFNGIPREILLWTQDILSMDQKKWLDELPREINTEKWLAVHGSPRDPHRFYAYVYVMTYHDNLETLEKLGVKRCFHGHTHVQSVYLRRGKQDIHLQGQKLVLEENDYALINPGSVGQPRGGVPGAEYALISEDLNEVEFCRVEYETAELLQRMQDANFPATLGQRILKGR